VNVRNRVHNLQPQPHDTRLAGRFDIEDERHGNPLRPGFTDGLGGVFAVRHDLFAFENHPLADKVTLQEFSVGIPPSIFAFPRIRKRSRIGDFTVA